jgi:hypothetical protein
MPEGIYRPTKADKKKYKGMSVVIAIPCKDYEMSASFARDVGNLIAYSWHNGLRVDQMAVTERMVVHWARNQLARECRDYKCPWTDKKFTHILWLDDDQAFTPDLLVCLARNQHLDVLGALYYGRQKHLPVVYIRDDSDDKYSHYTMLTVPAHVIEVDAMGFGGVLMRREVLDKLKEPYFKFDNAGEDIYFCAHAKEQGVKIHLDGSYDMGHMGDPEVVTRQTYEKYVKDHEAEFGQKIEKRTVIGA